MNKTFRIAITPLSPIHIGCDEVYDPTGYVVDVKKKKLYCFNLAAVFLQDRTKNEIRSIVRFGDYVKIANVFSNHITELRPYANAIVLMDSKSLQGYGKMLEPGKDQGKKAFEISRTAYKATLSLSTPYIPGSTLKGMIKTALVNCVNHARPKDNSEIDKMVLGEEEAKDSTMRFLKVGDMHTKRKFVATSACGVRRFYKKPPYLHCVDSSCVEVVEAGQYRLFEGEITLVDSSKVNNLRHVYKSINALVSDANSYSMGIWRREIAMYRSANREWANSTEKLLNSIQNLMNQGKCALIRIGKNSGAESKTLRGDKVARIKIKHRNGDSEKLDHTTALCFAKGSVSGSSEKETVSGLPFGWAILEVLDETPEENCLKNWCLGNFPSCAISEESLQAEWETICAEREEREKVRTEKVREIEARKLAEKEEEEEAAKLEAERQQMTPERRASVELCEKLHKTKGNINSGTELFTKTQELLEKALTWESVEDRKFLKQTLRPEMDIHGMFQGKSMKKFKQQLRELAGE